MKFKIVFYLFLFVCVILFFQLINTNKILNHQDRLIQSQNSLQLRLKDSISNLKNTLDVQQYFTFEEVGERALSSAIKDQLLAYNTKGDLNQLIPMLPEGERFLIETIQLVNSEWVLIGFRSDQNKGQAFLTYQTTNSGIEFKSLVFRINPL